MDSNTATDPGTARSSGPGPAAQARRGLFLLGSGGAIGIVTHWLRTASAHPAQRYLPWVLMLAGGYIAVTGLEKLAAAWRARGSVNDPVARVALRRWLAAGVIMLPAVAAGGVAAWVDRAPYWRAVAALKEGNDAADSLRAIAERHAARVQSAASGDEALASWRDTATQAIALKDSFARSREAAAWLAGASSGSVKDRADEDLVFYGLCLEWMALYETVIEELRTVSMAEPPAAWSDTQDAIIERIQQLPSARPPR